MKKILSLFLALVFALGICFSAPIAITAEAAECAHSTTELVNKKEPVCYNYGYTGDLVCSDCGAVIETGNSIPFVEGEKHEVDEYGACKKCGVVVWYYENIDGTAKITYYNGNGGEVCEIPEVLGGLTVTAIDNSIFNYSMGYSFDCISIPETVTEIDPYAFSGCHGLTSFVVAENNKAFSAIDGVLFNKEKTELVSYPSGKSATSYTIPQGTKKIWESAFSVGEEDNLNEIIIADTVEEIGMGAFYGCTSLTSIIIPDSVTTIGVIAFENCRNLENVTIGSGIKYIDGNVFGGCRNLRAINVSENNKNYTSVDGVLFNKEKTELVSYPGGKCTTLYAVPQGTKKIGYSAFEYVCSIDRITIADTVEEIGANAFNHCSSLTSIVIPDSVTTIGDGAFYYCENLENVSIGSGVKYIGDSAFVDTALKEVALPVSIEVLHCTSFGGLGTEKLPEKVLYAGSKEDWEKIKFSDEGGEIGLLSAFLTASEIHYNATNSEEHIKTKVVREATCGKVGKLNYSCNCGYSYNENIPSLGNHNFVKGICSACGLDESLCVETTHPYSDGGEFKIHKAGADRIAITFSSETKLCPDDMDMLSINGSYYFMDKSAGGMYSEGRENFYPGNRIVFPGDTVTISIDGCCCEEKSYYGFAVSNVEVFYEPCAHEDVKVRHQREATCKNSGYAGGGYCNDCQQHLSGEIIDKLPHSFENGVCKNCGCSIWAYDNCDNEYISISQYNGNDKIVEIPSSINGIPVTRIDWEAFRGNKIIEKVVIPDSVTVIGEWAFRGCTSLKTIVLPQNITFIGNYTFENTAYYNNADNWENGVLYVGNNLVCYDEENTDKMPKELIIKNGTTCIAENAMRYAPITKVVIPGTVKTIGSGAFIDTSLEEVVISSGVKTISEDAFRGCMRLKKVEIPKSVTEIGRNAFGYYYDYGVFIDGMVKILDATICGEKGSAAEKYANDNGFTFKVSAHTHSYEEKVTTAPTCEGKGVKTFTCTCGDSYTEVIPATGHSEKVLPAVGATCTATGLTEGKQCTVCGTVTVAQQTVDKKAHTEKVLPAVGATCTATGLTEGKQCTVCGTVTVAQQTIPATGHKEEVLVAVAPTCEGTGLTEGKKCTVCGVVTVAQTEVAALGHTESDWIVDKAASFSEEGSHHKECTVCKKVLATETLPMQALEVPVVKIANATNGIKVSWSMDADATGYTVYRSEYNAKTKTWSKWSNRGTAKADKSSWVDTKVNHGTYYKYTVRSVNGKNMSEFKATGSLMFITTPAVKIANNAAGMKVAWSKVAGATGYTVYRSEFQNGAWTNWKTMGTAKADKSSWVDKNVVSGVEYKYTVRAVVNKAASAYVDSNVAMYLAQPTVKAVNAANGVSVSWNAVNGAQNYKVYRSVYNAKTKKWSGWSELGTVAETSCVDSAVANNTHYKYTVRAVNGANISTYVASKNVLFVTAPTVKIANNAAGMKVAWSKVAGATGYTVYRSELQNGAWTKWKTMGTAKADKSSWIDKSAVSGVEYKYTVRALNNKVASAFVDSNSVIFLAQPTVKIAGCATGIKVTWNGINGAQSYNVYRAVYNATTKKWSGWSVIATATETNYVDATAVSGTYYKYTVRAVNGKNMSTYKATGALYYLAEPVTTLTVVENGINVAWTQSAGATGYTVYRSQYDPATNTWSKWSNRGTAKANKNNWTDKKTTQGVTYKYAVRAVNGKLKSTYTETVGVTR